MQHFLNVAIPGYIAPRRQTVCKKLATQYAKYHENLKEIKKKPTYIALTTDAWKNSNLSHFLCITAHFFDDNFSMKPIIVAFRKFKGRNLHQRIEKFLNYEIDLLGIREKVVSITTDNGSDITAATKKFNLRVSCAAHNLNLVLKTILKFKKPKKYKQF